MEAKAIIDYLNYLWPIRKTKWGLAIASIIPFLLWICYLLPKFDFVISLIYPIVLWLIIFVTWLFHSGRTIKSKEPFTVIFCLKSSDANATKYLQNSMKILNNELDKLGLLRKIHIKQIGHDIINNNQQALSYREKFDIGLIIWGEIFTGSKSEKEVCDFKHLYFTFKVPENLTQENIYPLFKNDINIALINRDWNIYEINSLPDTEKISENLSEIILFILGLIYAQYLDFAEDSGVILESLSKLLEAKTENEKIFLDDAVKPTQLQMSPRMLQRGRTLAVVISLYKGLGIHFVENKEYTKGIRYLKKCIEYRVKDIDVFSSAAFASFYLNNLDDAKAYTDQINEIEEHHPAYILNYAFFGIYKENYASALFYYKEITKRGRIVDNAFIIKIIAFLDERKSDNPREIAYDFAIGLLNFFHFQKKAGSNELRQFLKAAKKKEKYREMVAFIENENILKTKKKKRRK